MIKIILVLFTAIYMLGFSILAYGNEHKNTQIANHEHYLKLSMALYYESQNNIANALVIYDDLYEKLKTKEYAKKVLYLSSLLQKDSKLITPSNSKTNKIKPNSKTKKLAQIYHINSLLVLEKKSEAIMYIKQFAKQYNNPIDSYITARFYQKLKNYKKAIYYYKIYKNKFGCKQKVCEKLALMYKNNYNYKKLLNILINMYNEKKITYSDYK
jgi:hypothetical protein